MAKKKNGKKPVQHYSLKQLDVLAKFGMGPLLGLSEKDAQLIDAVDELGDLSFYSLCDRFDEKPSKLYKRISVLREKNLIMYSDTEQIVSLTPLAIQFMGCSLEDSKSQKKFRKFIVSLNDEELDRLMQLVDQFEIDETLDSSEEIGEEASDDAVSEETESEEVEEAEPSENEEADEADKAEKESQE